MGDWLIGLGILLAAIGPVLMLPSVWVVYRMIYRPLLSARLTRRLGATHARRVGVLASALLLGLVCVLSYLPGRVTFERLCAAEGVPRVVRREKVPGFYRTRLLPYEAQAYLGDGAFRFVEAPDPYRSDEIIRYGLGTHGALLQARITRMRSHFAVDDTHTEVGKGVSISRKRIYALDDDEELAKAAFITFSGGPLSLLFGVYAMADCPDVRDAVGSQRFRLYYELEQRVLGGKE